MLMRFRSIKAAATKIPRTIPVPFTTAALINEFNRELINMRGYYNDVSSVGAVRQRFGGAIDNIVGIVNAGGDDFYFDEGFLTQYLPEVRSLSSQLKDVSDRYAFYRMLVAAQDAEAGLAGSSVKDKPFGSGGGTTGYKSFGVSLAVTEDLNRGDHSLHRPRECRESVKE